tara:strand:+ start:18077 stop:18634 length:558 start_codon:yes stop_codon:yes gene_type:complete
MVTLRLIKNEILEEMKLYFFIALTLYKSKGISQLLVIFFTASASIPFIESIKKFLIPTDFDNWVIFLTLLLLDVVSGIYKHSGLWAKGEPNTLDKDDFFFKLFRKVFAGCVWLILINVILKLENSSAYFDSFGIGVLISWLGWSIAANIYVVSGSTFPPKWIMKKLKLANEGEEDPDKNTPENGK